MFPASSDGNTNTLARPATVLSGALRLATAEASAASPCNSPSTASPGIRARTSATRILVIVVALLALGFWIEEQRTLVELILIYYNGVVQFLPGVVAALTFQRVSAWSVAAGLVTGFGLVVLFTLSNTPLWGLNPGLVALGGNVVVTFAVALVLPRRSTS